MKTNDPENLDHLRIPWPATAAALASFAALYVTSGGYVGLIVLALLLIATYLTKIRLPDRIVFLWTVRAAAFAAIVLTAPYSKSFNISVLYEPSYVNRFGFMCAAELVLRAWTRREKGPWLAEVIFLSALIIAAASNTFEHRAAFHLIAPIYALFLIFSMRRLGRPPLASRRWRPGLVALRTVAVVLALATGFTAIRLVEKHDNQLMYWAVHLLRKRTTTVQNQIGLSAAPRVGPVFNPEPSTERVLRARGDVSERHLRALAFDSYEQRAWRPILQERTFATHPVPPVTATADAPTGGAGVRIRFDRLGDTLGLIILPIETEQLTLEGGVEADPLGVLRDAEDDVWRYDAVIARRQSAQGIAAHPMDDAARARCLALPAHTDPKLIILARQVAGDASPMERVIRISNYLRSNCRYSLSADPGAGDAIANFVLNTRAGHCVFFGSAVAIMSRAAGVPSRFVTGYYAHERAGDDELVVRQRDAHAWAECWIDGVGWVTIDATPAGGLPDQVFPEPSFIRRLWERIIDFPMRIKDWVGALRRSTVVALLAGVAIALAIVWVWRRRFSWRRSGAKTDPGVPMDPELAALARRFEQALKRQQVAVLPQRTWREQTRLIAASRGELIRRFVDEYDCTRFGPVRVKPDRRLHALLDEIESVPTELSHDAQR